MGLALEITDWQDLDGEYEMEKNRLRLRYQELHVVKEWDGDLEGFTAIQLREQAKTLPILDSTMRFIEHLRDYREKLAEAAVRRYEATEQWLECPKCETEVPTSNGIHCPECGEDMRGGEYVRAILHLVDDAEHRRGRSDTDADDDDEQRGVTGPRQESHLRALREERGSLEVDSREPTFRFDEEGWNKIIDLMKVVQNTGAYPANPKANQEQRACE